MERVFYSASVHDEAEIAAVVEVLRSGPQGLWPGKRVTAMEREVAKLFGKQRGVMVNSGSSALYLAVELLSLPKGTEVIVPAIVFSTDVAPLVRAGLIPCRSAMARMPSQSGRLPARLTPRMALVLGVIAASILLMSMQ